MANVEFLRACLWGLAAVGCCAGQPSPATGQDNPVLRERLEQKIVEELSKHASLDTAWYHEKSVNKQKWTDGKILGRKIRLASWTEVSKSWVWLDDPKSTLSLDLTHLAVRNGRVEFSLAAKAKAGFKVSGRIPKLAQATVGGKVRLDIAIDGSAAVGNGHLEDARITTFKAVANDLDFNNPVAGPLEDLAKDSLNDYAQRKNEKLRASIEKAIDRVRF